MSKLSTIHTSITALAILGAVGVISIAALRSARSNAAQRLYKERLTEIADDYETLRSRYNQAVRETAVTEILVEDRAVSVTIRTIEGQTKTIPTPFTADREIYVDFALVAGRLWIRRVFDADTPPSKAVVIDPDLADIDWQSENAKVGQAVYRALAEGRWIVTTTGDGSLALTQVPKDAQITLAPPPELDSFDELETQIEREVANISLKDVMSSLISSD